MSTPWSQDPAWDTCILGSVTLPGICRVTVNFPSGLDIKKPRGAKKAWVTDNGDPPAEISIEVELDEEDSAAFAACVNTLRPRSRSGPRQPLTIVHPATARWGVTSVVIGDITCPPPNPGGSQTISIKAVEWASEPTKVKKQETKPQDAEDAATWMPYRDDNGVEVGTPPSADNNSSDNLIDNDPLTQPV